MGFTGAPPSANADWLARSRAAVWHPCTQMKQHETLPLVPIARGAGAWLYDFDGNRYLDAVSSWWVNLFGHAHPRINAALRAQLDELDHVLLAGFTHQPVVELWRDDEFVAEAEKTRMTLNPIPGATLHKMIVEGLLMPAALKEKLKPILAPKG